MDARIFAAEPIGLKDDLLTMPLEARFAYDAERNMFFLVQPIGTEVGNRLAVIGKKVRMVINPVASPRLVPARRGRGSAGQRPWTSPTLSARLGPVANVALTDPSQPQAEV